MENNGIVWGNGDRIVEGEGKNYPETNRSEEINSHEYSLPEKESFDLVLQQHDAVNTDAFIL
jgi:hypothetical protein